MTELRKLGHRPHRNPADVRRVRAIYYLGWMNQPQLAADYDVEVSRIHRWLNIPAETLLAREQAWSDHKAVEALQRREQLGSAALRRRAAELLGLRISTRQAEVYAMPGERERQRQHSERFARSPAGKLLGALFDAWERCSNPGHRDYHHYGKRGIRFLITVERPGRDDARRLLPAFQERGWEPGLKLDRIDNHGHYELGNLRFISSAENNRNKRNNVWLRRANTAPMVLADACALAGVSGQTATVRRSRHPLWTADRVIGPGWFYCTQEGEPCDPPPIAPRRKPEGLRL